MKAPFGQWIRMGESSVWRCRGFVRPAVLFSSLMLAHVLHTPACLAHDDVILGPQASASQHEMDSGMVSEEFPPHLSIEMKKF